MNEYDKPDLPQARPIPPHGELGETWASGTQPSLPDGQASIPEMQQPSRYAAALKMPEPLTLPSLSRPQAWMDLLLVFGTAVVAQYGVETFVMIVAPPAELPSLSIDAFLILAKKTGDLLLALTLVVYLLHRNRLPLASFGLQYTRVLGAELALAGAPRFMLATLLHGVWAIAIVVATYYTLLMVIVLIMVVVLVLQAAGVEVASPAQNPMIDALSSTDGMTLLGLFALVAAHEELIFRALMVTLLRRAGGSWFIALLVSSAVFAVLHIIQGIAVIGLIFVGVTFAVSFVVTRNIIPVIIAHLIFNSMQVQIARIVMEWMQKSGHG